MIKSKFLCAILEQTKFCRIDLTAGNFSLAALDKIPSQGGLFDSVTLKNANFTNINLDSIKLIKCNLVEIYFVEQQRSLFQSSFLMLLFPIFMELK
jgi:uncharacterized protein YjbI with pentapeptide repeats